MNEEVDTLVLEDPIEEDKIEPKSGFYNFEKEVEGLINKYGIDNFAEIPDFILAQYVVNSIKALAVAKKKDKYYKD